MKEIKTNSKNINKSKSSSRFGKSSYKNYNNKKFVRKNYKNSKVVNSVSEEVSSIGGSDLTSTIRFARTNAWNTISSRKDVFETIRDYRLTRLNLEDFKIGLTIKAGDVKERSKTLKSLAEKKLKLKFNLESSLRQERFLKRYIKRSITKVIPFLARRYYRLPRPKVYKNKSKGLCYKQPKFSRYKNRIIRKTLLNNFFRARVRLHLKDAIESDGFVYDDNFQSLLDFFYKTDLFVLEGLKKSKILDPINVIVEFKELARNAAFAVKGLNEMTVNSAAVTYGLKSDEGLKNISYFKTEKDFLNLRNIRLENKSNQTFNVFTPETEEDFNTYSKFKKEITTFSRTALRGKKLLLKIRAYTLLRRMELTLSPKKRYFNVLHRNFYRYNTKFFGENKRLVIDKKAKKSTIIAAIRNHRRISRIRVKTRLRIKTLLLNYVYGASFKNTPLFSKRRNKFRKFNKKLKVSKNRLNFERRINRLKTKPSVAIDEVKRLSLSDYISIIKEFQENSNSSVENNSLSLNFSLKIDELFSNKVRKGRVWSNELIEMSPTFEIYKFSKVNKSYMRMNAGFLKSASMVDFMSGTPDLRYTSINGRKLFRNKLTKFALKFSCGRTNKSARIQNANRRRQGIFVHYKKRKKSRRFLMPRARKALKRMSKGLRKHFAVSTSTYSKRRNIQQAVLPRKAVLFQKLLYRRLALEKLSENGLIDFINNEDSNVVIEDFLKSDKILQTISRSNLKLFYKRYARIFFYVADPYLYQLISKIVEELPALSLCCAVVKNHKELLSYREDSNLQNSRNMVFFFGKEPNKDVYRTNLRSKFYLMHLINSYSKLTANGPEKIFTYRTSMDLATIGKITALFTLLDQVIVNEVFPILNLVHESDDEFLADNLENTEDEQPVLVETKSKKKKQ